MMQTYKYRILYIFCLMGFYSLAANLLAGEPIEFNFRKEDPRFSLRGFSGFESWGCWTEGEEAEIRFAHPHSFLKDGERGCKDWFLELSTSAYVPLETSHVTAEVSINGKVIRLLQFEKEKNYAYEMFSLSDFREAENLSLLLKIKGQSSPASHGLSGDSRSLGIGCSYLKVYGGTIITISPEKERELCAESKDFRLTEPPDSFLFSPLEYSLKSTLYGEQEGSFEWLGTKERALKGGELFIKKNVLLLANNSAAFLTDGDFNNVLMNYNPALGGSLLEKTNILFTTIPGRICVFRLERICSMYYFEFMLNVLPTIYFLTKKYSNNIRFLYPGVLQPYENEAFKAISFDGTKQLIPFSKVALSGSLSLSLEELVVPSFGIVYWREKQQQREFYPEIIEFLRQTFLLASPPTPRKTRIYISRDDMLAKRGIISPRSIVNESEILGLLSEHNFIKIILTGKSIVEQAKIFNEAEVVIGAHGTGFTNLVFCEKGTKVLEFIPPDWEAMAYFHLSAIAGLEHSCIMGTAWEKGPNASFYLDPEALTSYLRANGLYNSLS